MQIDYQNIKEILIFPVKGHFNTVTRRPQKNPLAITPAEDWKETLSREALNLPGFDRAVVTELYRDEDGDLDERQITFTREQCLAFVPANVSIARHMDSIQK